MIMRFRPANISLINRRHYLPRLLLILSSKYNDKNNPDDLEILTGHTISGKSRPRSARRGEVLKVCSSRKSIAACDLPSSFPSKSDLMKPSNLAPLLLATTCHEVLWHDSHFTPEDVIVVKDYIVQPFCFPLPRRRNIQRNREIRRADRIRNAAHRAGIRLTADRNRPV